MFKNIVSDCGSFFISKSWSTLCYYLGARHCLPSNSLSPANQQENRIPKSTLEHYLRAYVNYEQDNWPQWLAIAQAVYNSTIHSSTDMTPCEALMNYTGDLGQDVLPPHLLSEAQLGCKCTCKMDEHCKVLKDHLQKAFEAHKKFYNKNHQPKTFKVCDWVTVNGKNIRTIRLCPKLDHQHLGPFQIVDA